MFETANRREFLKLSALFGAGAVVFGRLPAYAANGITTGAIGELTSIGLVDDTLHLAEAVSSLSQALRESLDFGINVFDPLPGNAAVAGRFMPADSGDISRLARRARDGWASRGDDDHFALSLALVTGWMVHRAGTNVIAPSLRDAPDVALAHAHQDAAVLRARSADQTASVSRDDVASLFMQTVPRTLTRLHTLIPDYDDGDGWVERLQQWRADHTEKMERYADAFVNTSSAEYDRFVSAPNFYDPDDEILKAASSIRRRDSADEVDIERVVEGRNESLYGKALAHSFRHLRALSNFLDGTLDAGGFEDQLAQG